MGEAELGVSYVLPLRWAEGGPIEELSVYLRSIAEVTDEILVVDGSPAPFFAEHAAALDGVARHLAPDPDLDFRMGKVNGVLTGVRKCANELVVLADDDVRYSPTMLRRAVGLLAEAELVRPQNYFDELPWHARWDTARSLLNRVFTADPTFPVGDFPGTLALRRSALLTVGGYDGDALFENLELMRTIHAAGGRVATPLDLYVPRQPPSTAHFLSQRVRQAYDDFAVPPRIGAFLAVAPLVARSARRGRARRLLAGALVSIFVAEIGRRRAGGATRFPLSASLLAPVWIAERSLCAWLALAAKLRGGVPYGERRLELSATPMRRLRCRHAGVLAGPRAEHPSGAVRHYFASWSTSTTAIARGVPKRLRRAKKRLKMPS
ncbi:MAG TPA: glycosyltransferase family 2 protein [Solirubrobacterales bacterium]|nr:glycosyltransferase family 2 protein [Solirubrobacterales bacterium]